MRERTHETQQQVEERRVPFVAQVREHVGDAAAIQCDAPCLQLVVPRLVMQVEPPRQQRECEQCNALEASIGARRAVVHGRQNRRANNAYSRSVARPRA